MIQKHLLAGVVALSVLASSVLGAATTATPTPAPYISFAPSVLDTAQINNGGFFTVNISQPVEGHIYLYAPGYRLSTCTIFVNSTNWNQSYLVFMKSPSARTPSASKYSVRADFIPKTGTVKANATLYIVDQGKAIPGQCTASGDPHYTTIDGLYYDFYGTWNLSKCANPKEEYRSYYLSVTPKLQIQAMHYPCAPGVSCMGAIALQYGSAVAIISALQNKRKITEFFFDAANVGDALANKKIEIQMSDDKRQYRITVEDGTYLEVVINWWDRANWWFMAVNLWVPGGYVGQTSGLCGLWDSNPWDDFTLSNGTTLPLSKSSTRAPLQLSKVFGESWVVPAEKNIILQCMKKDDCAKLPPWSNPEVSMGNAGCDCSKTYTVYQKTPSVCNSPSLPRGFTIVDDLVVYNSTVNIISPTYMHYLHRRNVGGELNTVAPTFENDAASAWDSVLDLERRDGEVPSSTSTTVGVVSSATVDMATSTSTTADSSSPSPSSISTTTTTSTLSSSAATSTSTTSSSATALSTDMPDWALIDAADDLCGSNKFPTQFIKDAITVCTNVVTTDLSAVISDFNCVIESTSQRACLMDTLCLHGFDFVPAQQIVSTNGCIDQLLRYINEINLDAATAAGNPNGNSRNHQRLRARAVKYSEAALDAAVQAIDANACPNDCGPKGHCFGNTCNCDPGYGVGLDNQCSVVLSSLKQLANGDYGPEWLLITDVGPYAAPLNPSSFKQALSTVVKTSGAKSALHTRSLFVMFTFVVVAMLLA